MIGGGQPDEAIRYKTIAEVIAVIGAIPFAA